MCETITITDCEILVVSPASTLNLKWPEDLVSVPLCIFHGCGMQVTVWIAVCVKAFCSLSCNANGSIIVG